MRDMAVHFKAFRHIRLPLKGLLFAALLAAACLYAQASQAAGLCKAHQNDDHLWPLPASLVPQMEGAFGLHDTQPDDIQKLTVVRCMNGKTWACFAGANLPCGKANTARHMPAAKPFCAENQEADFIPAYITGHDSIYTWRCKAGAPVFLQPPAKLDRRGFFTQYWHELSG